MHQDSKPGFNVCTIIEPGLSVKPGFMLSYGLIVVRFNAGMVRAPIKAWQIRHEPKLRGYQHESRNRKSGRMATNQR